MLNPLPPRRIALPMALMCLLALPAAARAQALPSGKEVLDRYIDVTGGRAAYEKVKSRVTKTTLELPAQNIKGDMTMYQQAPNKGYIETVIPSVGKVEQGYDGAIAWEKSAMMGSRVLEGQEKESLVRNLTIGADLEPEKFYEKIETVGEEQVDGKPAYKVQLTTPGGATETRYYDKASGLMIKFDAAPKTQMGEIQVTSTPSDYQVLGGIKMPKKVTQNMMGQTITLTINDVQHNVDIPAEKFQVPADVKALAEKGAGAGAGAGPTTQPK